MTPKKLLFVGAGAIGSYLGAFLARAGHDVTLVDPRAEQVETIRQHGIAVRGPHEPFEAQPTAVHLNDAARLSRDDDIVFVAMKVYDTAWAGQLALRHAAPDGYVVSAQNCWPDPTVAAVVGAARGRARHVQDRRRPTEIDLMNGYVLARGRECGVATPVSAAVVDIMHEVERGARPPAPENIALALRRAGV